MQKWLDNAYCCKRRLRNTTIIKKSWRYFLKYVEWQKTQQVITTGQIISRFCIDDILGCVYNDQERWFFFFLGLGESKITNHIETEQCLDNNEKIIWKFANKLHISLSSSGFHSEGVKNKTILVSKSQPHQWRIMLELNSFPLFRVYKLRCRTHCFICMSLCTAKRKSDFPALAQIDMPKILPKIWNKEQRSKMGHNSK